MKRSRRVMSACVSLALFNRANAYRINLTFVARWPRQMLCAKHTPRNWNDPNQCQASLNWSDSCTRNWHLETGGAFDRLAASRVFRREGYPKACTTTTTTTTTTTPCRTNELSDLEE
ncbi:hypothetical protein BDV96DRAFT_119409 [Lophiotrema nucula]|uniref:Secreted protein n=1 Tax=Lophiotrema nucula TaxID=690887 RepID=A0A6A5Z2H5_9PLEO|nr:hypothetical protein BDV96DRAFT_119409 [Lophiotrema nucula]